MSDTAMPHSPDSARRPHQLPRLDQFPTHPALHCNDMDRGLQGEFIDRYALHRLIGTGGMASVYVGTCAGAADFFRIVAIKRMHPPFAQNPTFAARFRDEAWLCARLLHPNIVQTLDVVEWKGEILLVMEFVEGATLEALQTDAFAADTRLPPNIALGILVPALDGLHNAHEAVDDEGRALGIVHRDFSPQNLMVSRDGNTKVLDFGVAMARGQMHVTSAGELWGKFGYLAPEQIYKRSVDRRADVFAAGVVLWEMLTGQRLFRERGLTDAGVIERVLYKVVPAPSTINPAISPALDGIVLRALQRDPGLRFESARAFALDLELALQPASPRLVAEFVESVSSERLANLATLRTEIRRCSLANDKTIPEAVPSSETSAPKTPAPSTSAPSTSTPSTPPQAWRQGWRRTGLTILVATALLSIALVVVVSWSPTPAAPALWAAGAETPAPPQRQQDTVGHAEEERLDFCDLSNSAIAKADDNLPIAPMSQANNRKSRLSEKGAHARKTTGMGHALPCDPPTYLDMEGVRHFKEGCL